MTSLYRIQEGCFALLKLFLIAPSISSSHRAMKGQLPV